MKKLAIVTTHPIQYHVPWLVRLAEKKIAIKVFYTYEQSRNGTIFDPGFGRNIQWDIPLLDGYEYEFVHNTARHPGLENFRGIVNPTLIDKIEAWQPDGLLVIGWNYDSHLKCLRHFHGRLPVYFRGDSVLLHERKGLYKLARRIFLTWVYHHVDYALYVGTNNKSYFLRHGLKGSQLIFSPQAIDIGRFAQAGNGNVQLAQRWKKELGIPAGHLTVLFAGKLTRVKNPGFVLDLANVCKDLPVSFVLVGDGYLKPELQQRAQGKTNVFFMGFQNQSVMPAVYRTGDIYLMPSLSETWGMGINEAMACGVPVMASGQVGCATDLVLENKTGMTFRLGDVEKCRKFLETICQDRTRLTEMGACASTLIQFFSFSHIVDSVVRAMTETLWEPARRKWMNAAL
ncbi:glycosyltransferase family 4 protein [Puia sp.]|jgi:glycosyltransferase involved in cell wall biosynthesis|uniref:glycosyltransferase family 4 protein n=1 Tax=Puia sp. TaxID=2045100 RepID=UPI002F3FD1B2